MLQLDSNKQLIKDFREQLANAHNLAAWDAYCADDYVHHFDLPGITPDREGMKRLWAGVLAAFPDMAATTEVLIAEGDLVVERATVRATHSGRYRDIEPTGQPYTWSETHVYRLRNGQIVEQHPEVRLEQLLGQIAGRGAGFVAPAKSALSSAIAFLMSGLSALYHLASPAKPTTAEANRQVVKRYVEEFKNQQKFGVFPKLFAPQFVHHFAFPGRTSRLDSFVSVGQNFLAAFPDVRVEIEALVAEANFVVERNRVSATHRGPFNGQAATGKPVHWTETHIYRLAEGRIVENWPAVNFERILLQLA